MPGPPGHLRAPHNNIPCVRVRTQGMFVFPYFLRFFSCTPHGRENVFCVLRMIVDIVFCVLRTIAGNDYCVPRPIRDTQPQSPLSVVS